MFNISENQETLYKTKDTGLASALLALSDEAKTNIDKEHPINYYRDISLYSVDKDKEDIVFTLRKPSGGYNFHELMNDYLNNDLKVDARRYRDAHKELMKLIKTNII